MNKEHIEQLAKEFLDSYPIKASINHILESGANDTRFIELVTSACVKFIQSMIEKGEVVDSNVSSAGEEVIESCERAKWLMVNRLFATEEYGEHPDVCELYEIIEDIQKSSPASTATPAKVISDEEARLWIEKHVPVPHQNSCMETVEWMRERLIGKP